MRYIDAALNEVSAGTYRYVDAAQEQELAKIKKQLDKGQLKDVRNKPEWWKVYTSIEIDYIINYTNRRKKNENRNRCS